MSTNSSVTGYSQDRKDGMKMYYDLVESGKRIKELRKRKGLSQSILAEQIGVHVKTISKAERGIIGLSVDNLLILAEYFSTSIDYLVRGKGQDVKSEELISILRNINDEQQKVVCQILKNILNFSELNKSN